MKLPDRLRPSGDFGRVPYLLGRGQGRKWAGLLALGVLASLVEVLGASMIVGLLALVSNPNAALDVPFFGDVGTAASSDGAGDHIALICVALTVFFLVRAGVLLLQGYASSRVVQNAGARLAARLGRDYLKMPYPFHLRRNSAEVVRNLFSGVSVFTNQFLTPVTTLLADTFVLVGLSIVLLVVAPIAALLSLVVVVPIVFGLLKFIQPRLKKLGRVAQDTNRVDLQTIQQALGGVRDIKVLGTEDHFAAKFRRGRYRLAHTQYLYNFLSQVPRTSIETLLILFILALLAGSVLIKGESHQVIPLIGLFAYAGLRLQPALQRIVLAVNSLKYSGAAIEDLSADLAKTESEAPMNDGESWPLSFAEAITLSHVGFAYEAAERNAVEGIDLVIPFGGSLGVVGPTGSGKSTLIDLLIGLLEPTDGSILVDGRNIRESLSSWYARIGIVSQTPFLLDESLRENVLFGRTDHWPDEQVLAALQRAQLSDFVRDLPEGLDTSLGERGARVSGGQRQRIAIARALLGDPAVLVLDEGTAALDAQTEGALMSAIAALGKSVTTIIVAHRLSTVRNCDQVIIMDAGRIRDRGRFAELHARDPLFRRLAALGIP